MEKVLRVSMKGPTLCSNNSVLLQSKVSHFNFQAKIPDVSVYFCNMSGILLIDFLAHKCNLLILRTKIPFSDFQTTVKS